MKSFKEFFAETKGVTVFSPKEDISIIGVGNFKAKIDSGNDAYGVLHGDDIEIGDDSVIFTTSDGKRISKPLIDTIRINVGAGVEEKRPIVHFDFILKGKTYSNQKFSIGNRSENEEKVLIGLKFLEPLKALIQC